MVRAAYLAMELTARFVIVPLSFAPLLTGPVLSLGTPWGLFRHYWILVKLLITILSTLILLVHLQPISYLSGVAAEATLSSADLSITTPTFQFALACPAQPRPLHWLRGRCAVRGKQAQKPNSAL